VIPSDRKLTGTPGSVGSIFFSSIAEVITLTATEGQTQDTGGVVVVTMTEDTTSTDPAGGQVVVVKVSPFSPIRLFVMLERADPYDPFSMLYRR
jgi:hypothetical protein